MVTPLAVFGSKLAESAASGGRRWLASYDELEADFD
jgi:hypothetical protein